MDKTSDGLTPYEGRFLQPFDGPIIPFVAEVTYKPNAPEYVDKLHGAGLKVLSGVLIGYSEQAG